MNRLIHLQSTESTNKYLMELAASENVRHGTVVTADIQTGGCGRKGRSFLSEEGGLYFSMLLKFPEALPEDLTGLTAAAGVCTCNAIRNAYGIDTGIKWVNDIMIRGRKVGGILAQASGIAPDGTIPYIVLGIGINVNQKEFSRELKDIATSLWRENEAAVQNNAAAGNKEHSTDAISYDIGILRDELIRELDIMSTAFLDKTQKDPAGAYLSEYRRLCITVGQEISYIEEGVTRNARALGISEDFELITDRGSLNSGEVSVRPVSHKEQ